MKLSPGDILEIESEIGLSYAQVTHEHTSYPEVVRVLAGTYQSRPSDLDDLARSETAFSAMIALGSAIEKVRISGSKLGTAALPDEISQFPIFRMSIRDKQGGIAYWWLWDGQGLRYETELSAEAKKYAMREVMSVEAFLSKLKQPD